MRRTTTAPARTGAGTGAAGSAQRLTLGRAEPTQEAPLPPPGLRSDPVSPQAPAPGLTHLTAPPTTGGPPYINCPHFRWPAPPGSGSSQLRTEPRPGASLESGPLRRLGTRGFCRAGLREATRAGPEGRHTHSRDPAPSCRSPRETLTHLVDARGRIGPIPRCSLFPYCNKSLVPQRSQSDLWKLKSDYVAAQAPNCVASVVPAPTANLRIFTLAFQVLRWKSLPCISLWSPFTVHT